MGGAAGSRLTQLHEGTPGLAWWRDRAVRRKATPGASATGPASRRAGGPPHPTSPFWISPQQKQLPTCTPHVAFPGSPPSTARSMMIGQFSGADGRLPIRQFGHGLGGFTPGLPWGQFPGPWIFSTAEARTSNSPSSVPKAGGVVCSRTKPHAPFFHEPRVAHLPVFMNAAFGRWRVFMNTREECSSGCVRSAGSATSTEGAVAPWGVRLSLRCVGELLATCDMRRMCGGARHRAPPLLAGRFFWCWRLAGGCWVLRCQFGIAWAGLIKTSSP